MAPQESGEKNALAVDPGQVVRSTSRKLLGLLLIGTAIFLAIHASPFGEHFRNWDATSRLTDLVKGGGFQSLAYFVLISSLLIMLGTPRLLFFSLGGFAFGFWAGLFWSLLSCQIGSFLTFYLARRGGQEWLTRHFGHHRFVERIARAKPTLTSVAVMRLLPVSNVIINIGLALSSVSNRAFLLGSFFGFLPHGVVAVIIGSGMADETAWTGAVQICIVGVLLLAINFWTSRKRSNRAQ